MVNKMSTNSRGARWSKSEAATVQMRRPRLNQMVTAELALCGEPTGQGLSRSTEVDEFVGSGKSVGTNALRESNRVGDERLASQAGLGKRSILKRLFGIGFSGSC